MLNQEYLEGILKFPKFACLEESYVCSIHCNRCCDCRRSKDKAVTKARPINLPLPPWGQPSQLAMLGSQSTSPGSVDQGARAAGPQQSAWYVVHKLHPQEEATPASADSGWVSEGKQTRQVPLPGRKFSPPVSPPARANPLPPPVRVNSPLRVPV